MIRAAVLALFLAGSAQAGPLGSEATVALTFSDHGSTCPSCNEQHLDVRLEWPEAIAPWATPTIAFLYPNSNMNPVLFGGVTLTRDLPLGLEAFALLGLGTGYDHLTGSVLSPLGFAGIRADAWELYVAPIEGRGGGIEPFFALRMTILRW